MVLISPLHLKKNHWSVISNFLIKSSILLAEECRSNIDRQLFEDCSIDCISNERTRNFIIHVSHFNLMFYEQYKILRNETKKVNEKWMHVSECSVINDFRDVPCGYEGRLKDAAPIPLRPCLLPPTLRLF